MTLPAELAARELFYLPDHDLLSRTYVVHIPLEMCRRWFNGGEVEAAAVRVGVSAQLYKRPAVLVRQPRCLLADEPNRVILPKEAADMTAVLESQAASGTAVLITGHEVPTLLAAADHISWCTNGTTDELGVPTVAVKQAAFTREYFGSGWSARDTST